MIALRHHREVRWRKPSIILEADPPLHTRTHKVLLRVLSPSALRDLKTDAIDAYRNGLAAAERLNEVDEYIARAGAIAAAPGDAFIRDALRYALSR